jgi:hypothetical protein
MATIAELEIGLNKVEPFEVEQIRKEAENNTKLLKR